jgi:SOS response regulatory protein OraA/RecX
VEAAVSTVERDAMLDRAREAARRRLPALRAARLERAAARLGDYLLRRGYPGPVVAQVLRETLGTPPEA